MNVKTNKRKNKMYKLVVFDLDGTLADTLSDLAHAVNESLKSVGAPTHPIDSYRIFVGNGVNVLIKQALVEKGEDEQLCKKVKSFFDSYYPQHLCDYTTAYDKMADLLAELEKEGVKTAVHSNKPHEFVPQIIEKLYPHHNFEVVIGNMPEYERKPSPQALIAIMDKLKVSAEETLYVGDSDVDVFTAHEACVKVCGVAWGFRGKEELVDAGADFIAHDSTELLDIIKGLV